MNFDKNVMQKVFNLFCIAENKRVAGRLEDAEIYMNNAKNLFIHEFRRCKKLRKEADNI